MTLKLLVALFLLFPSLLFAVAIGEDGLFSGRVSKINQKASLLRIKIDFINGKYLNKKDKVSFWNEISPTKKCEGIIVGKSPDYMLVQVVQYQTCEHSIFLTPGAYLKFHGKDLANNLRMGKELSSILIRKHTAVNGMINNHKKELDRYIEKVGAVNSRYKVLREKLEDEWRRELAMIEEDRAVTYQLYSDLIRKRDELDFKMEQYRVADENLETDKWALDPHLYYKK